MGNGNALTAVICAVFLLVGSCQSPDNSAQPEYDLLIKEGVVVDGTGQEGFSADVAISGDRIARVSRDSIASEQAQEVIEAKGLVVAPGFIDHHAHLQSIHERPIAESFVRQGVTSILNSLHSHDQPWPLDAYTDTLDAAPNIGFFAGHNWARRQVLGTANRAPSPEELDRMKELVRQSMEDGALGLSTGLRYVPGAYAETEEVIELARVAAEYDGYYVSHMRDEGPGVVESVRELIRIAEEAGLPAQIQHVKAMGNAQWGLSESILTLVDSARTNGLDITLDVYPYTATSTSSRVLFPSWALAGGPDSLNARLSDPQQRSQIEAEIRERILEERGGGNLENIQFARFSAYPDYNGKSLADFAADRDMPNTVETGVQLAVELQLQGGFAGTWHVLDEDDVRRFMRYPHTMFCSDGDLVGYGNGNPHPRAYGAFPRVLGRYVRDQGVLSLPEAVRRMTSLSSAQIGQSERGIIREGMYADVSVFDAEEVVDQATFTDPHRYASGIKHVIINGEVVLRDGSLTGATPGRILQRTLSSSSD